MPIGQFARKIERLPDALKSFKEGADTIGRIGADLEAIGSASESLRRGVAMLGRIETLLGQIPSTHAELEEINADWNGPGPLSTHWPVRGRRLTSGLAVPRRNSSPAA